LVISEHLQNFVKLRSNIKMPQKWASSVTRHEIPQPAKNCGPSHRSWHF